MRFVEGHIELLDEAGIKDESVDILISNCVVNLSPDKARILREAYRVLAPGGEMYFSDVYCDRRLPDHAKKDEVTFHFSTFGLSEGQEQHMFSAHTSILQRSSQCCPAMLQSFTRAALRQVETSFCRHSAAGITSLRCPQVMWGECISGALYINDFLNLARAAGFEYPIMLQKAPIAVNDPRMRALLGNAQFFSITYRLFKLPGLLEPECEDYGHIATYKVPSSPILIHSYTSVALYAYKPYAVLAAQLFAQSM